MTAVPVDALAVRAVPAAAPGRSREAEPAALAERLGTVVQQLFTVAVLAMMVLAALVILGMVVGVMAGAVA